MNRSSSARWIARGLASCLCLFLALFALEEIKPGKPVGQMVVDVLISLWASAVVLLVLALSWRRQWLGAMGFLGLAAAYAIFARSRPDWILGISGPLLLVGILYVWSWRADRTATP